ncbi:MAG TPA: hypothetical protein VGL71_11075, partial [Urbifossiella sp.]
YIPSRTEMVEAPIVHPILLQVQNEKPRILETWTLTLMDISANGNQYRFRVSGSVTGPDGEGDSTKRFVSKSGRVAIDPGDLLMVFPAKWVLDHVGRPVNLRWTVQPMFVDEFAVPARRNPFGDTVVVAAQGLSNGKHTLEITGGPETPLAGIRIYRPPLR